MTLASKRIAVAVVLAAVAVVAWVTLSATLAAVVSVVAGLGIVAVYVLTVEDRGDPTL